MNVVVCAMAKNEHKYINEWVAHYLGLGVDKIYIYDNDDLDKPYIKDFIDTKYLDKCVIKNIRGQQKPKLQQQIYTGFYYKYGNTFDWCLYCDIDEFLDGITNIKEWLATIKAPQVRIMWRLFGDDNLIERDTYKVYGEFKQVVKETLHRNLKQKGDLEIQGKFILKGGLSNVYISSPHFASFGSRDNIIPSVLPSGRECLNSGVRIMEDYSNETIYLNHYMTKTLKEFVEQKLNRNDAVFNQALKIDYFWRINRKTQEKIKWLQDMGLI